MLRHLFTQKHPLSLFIFVAATFSLNPWGLTVKALAPDVMMSVEMWGLGFFLFDRSGFVCVEIPVQ